MSKKISKKTKNKEIDLLCSELIKDIQDALKSEHGVVGQSTMRWIEEFVKMKIRAELAKMGESPRSEFMLIKRAVKAFYRQESAILKIYGPMVDDLDKPPEGGD